MRISGKLLRTTAILLSMGLVLSACNTVDGWLGESDDETLEGKRIPILKTERSIYADPALAGLAVELPPMQENNGWYKSHGRPSLVPDNSQFPESLTRWKSVDIGKSWGAYDVRTMPVIAEDKIITIDATGLLVAIKRDKSHDLVWKYQIKRTEESDQVYSNPGLTYQDGHLYVASGADTVICLDAKTGKLVWERSVNSMVRSAPAIGENAVFVNTIDNRLYALDIKDGAILWTHSGVVSEVGMLGSASPVFADDVVIAPYSSGELFALNKYTGEVVWSDSLSVKRSSYFSLSDIDASPVVQDLTVIATSQDGVIAAYNITNGSRLWEKPISSKYTPWVAGNFIYLLSDKNEVICLYLPTGDVRWVLPMPSYENEVKKKDNINWSGPVLAGDNLWIVGSHGKLLKINPKEGTIIKEQQVKSGVFIPPVIAYQEMYLLNDRADLIILEK